MCFLPTHCFWFSSRVVFLSLSGSFSSFFLPAGVFTGFNYNMRVNWCCLSLGAPLFFFPLLFSCFLFLLMLRWPDEKTYDLLLFVPRFGSFLFSTHSFNGDKYGFASLKMLQALARGDVRAVEEDGPMSKMLILQH